jgi:hypothetical protein
MLGFHYSFGDYDGVVIADMPDNISPAATSIVSFAGHYLQCFLIFS